MNNPYISDLKLPTNCIKKVIADIDNDVYSDSIVKLDVNSIKIGTVLGLHAIIKREVKVTSAVLLTLCDIQRAANNIKCTATNISRAIEKCKKLRGAKKIDFFTETFKLPPSIVRFHTIKLLMGQLHQMYKKKSQRNMNLQKDIEMALQSLITH